MEKYLGEMFLNFPLPIVFQSVSGINLRQFKNDLGFEDCTERRWKFADIPLKKFKTVWTKCWMGFRASPFYAVFFYHMAKEFVRGNNLDQKNALRWDEIVLNLPGSRNLALP